MPTSNFAQPDISILEDRIVISIPRFLIEKKGKKNKSYKGNAQEVLSSFDKAQAKNEALKEAFHDACGVLPHDSIDGVAYEDEIRQEAEEHFKALNW